jgi:hypothetical protein
VGWSGKEGAETRLPMVSRGLARWGGTLAFFRDHDKCDFVGAGVMHGRVGTCTVRELGGGYLGGVFDGSASQLLHFAVAEGGAHDGQHGCTAAHEDTQHPHRHRTAKISGGNHFFQTRGRTSDAHWTTNKSTLQRSREPGSYLCTPARVQTGEGLGTRYDEQHAAGQATGQVRRRARAGGHSRSLRVYRSAPSQRPPRSDQSPARPAPPVRRSASRCSARDMAKHDSASTGSAPLPKGGG